MKEVTLEAKKILADNLKAYRAFYKVSQLEMAKRVHMSYRGYGKMERLEVAASLDTLEKVADCLGLSPAMLLCQDMMQFIADPRQMKKTEKELAAEFEKKLEDVIDNSVVPKCDINDSCEEPEIPEETIEIVINMRIRKK